MTTDTIDPEVVLETIRQVRHELLHLIEVDKRAYYSKKLTEHINKLEVSNDVYSKGKASVSLVAFVAIEPQARKLFLSEMNRQRKKRLFKSIEIDLNAICTELEIDTTQISLAADIAREIIKEVHDEDINSQQQVIIPKGGLGPGKSLKFRNIKLDLLELTELVSGLLLTSADKKLNPLLIIAGVLLIVRSIYKMMSVDISAQEASVFWSAIYTRNTEDTVIEEVLIEHTNNERQKFGLATLTADQVINSLYKLQLIGSIEKADGSPNAWKIIENYRFIERTV